MRKTIVLCISVLLIGTLFAHVSARTLQISQGFTYWNGTAKYDWYGDTYKAEAPWVGLKIDLVVPSVWWAECLLATGEADFVNAGDTIYAREAQLLAGLFSSELGLGIGGIWMSEDYSGCLPPFNTLGALATVRVQFPFLSDSLSANVSITAQPIVFGENPLPREFIEFYAGINLETSWLRVNAGYRHRYFYNYYDSDWRVSGLTVSFLLPLGEDGV